MLDRTVTEIVFDLLNFIVLIGIISYIFYAYLYDMGLHAITHIRKGLETIRTRTNSINQSSSVFKTQAADEQAYAQKLLEHVTMWRDVYANTQEQDRRDVVLRQDKMVARATQQKEHILGSKRAQVLLVDSIEQVRAELLAQFAHPEKQEAFITELEKLIEKQI